MANLQVKSDEEAPQVKSMEICPYALNLLRTWEVLTDFLRMYRAPRKCQALKLI